MNPAERADNMRVAQNALHLAIKKAEERTTAAEKAYLAERTELFRLEAIRDWLLPVGHDIREAAGLTSTPALDIGIRDLLEAALRTDGGHHKQWYLEELAARLGFDPLALRDCAEPGVAP